MLNCLQHRISATTRRIPPAAAAVNMVLVADDLQRIIADLGTNHFANRKAILALGIATLGLSVTVLALAVSLGVSSHSVARWNWLYGGDRCATPDCLRTAAWIAESLDLDVSSSVNASGLFPKHAVSWHVQSVFN